MYKAKIQVPTGQYAFIQIEAEGTVEELKRLHDELAGIKPETPEGGFGLPEKEWNCQLDKFLKDEGIDANQYEKMSPRQQDIIQEIKRGLKRIVYKNNH